MKTKTIKCIAMVILMATASCQEDPKFTSGAACGACADLPIGDVGQFPIITSFSPAQGHTPFANTGIPGTVVTINGASFSYTPASNTVKFNGVVATVLSSNYSQIMASVPASATTGRISVTVNSQTGISSTDFTVLPENVWQQVGNFGGIEREGAVSFVIKNFAYVGTGVHSTPTGQTLLRDFWQYDPASDVWTQKADFGGGGRKFASGFAIGSKGYIGLGLSAGRFSPTPEYLPDLWQYNPQTNTWVPKASLPAAGRIGAAAFAIDTKGYVGTGLDYNSTLLNDFWQYDPVTDTWTRKKDFGGNPRHFAGAFVINGKGYLGAGINLIADLQPDFWEYNVPSNSWVAKASIGPNCSNHHSGFFSIGSKGYAGGDLYQLWMFDPIANTWQQKAQYPINTILGVGFAVEGYGYMGLGALSDPTANARAFYKYTPD
jgi:N-acetylneuraminic acid mutarotase